MSLVPTTRPAPNSNPTGLLLAISALFLGRASTVGTASYVLNFLMCVLLCTDATVYYLQVSPSKAAAVPLPETTVAPGSPTESHPNPFSVRCLLLPLLLIESDDIAAIWHGPCTNNRNRCPQWGWLSQPSHVHQDVAEGSFCGRERGSCARQTAI